MMIYAFLTALLFAVTTLTLLYALGRTIARLDEQHRYNRYLTDELAQLDAQLHAAAQTHSAPSDDAHKA